MNDLAAINSYLHGVLRREAVNTGTSSPALNALVLLTPLIRSWAHPYPVRITPSGSFAKGTANRSGTDIDLFVSLPPNARFPLRQVYSTLTETLRSRYRTKEQNVSIGIQLPIGNSGRSYSVDIIPAHRHNFQSEDHSIWRRKAATHTKTNIVKHIAAVRRANRPQEIRLIKLWRSQRNLEFPSFYLELATIYALREAPFGYLAPNVVRVLEYLRDDFVDDNFLDPANASNIVSDDLTIAEKNLIRRQASTSLELPWTNLVH